MLLLRRFNGFNLRPPNVGIRTGVGGTSTTAVVGRRLDARAARRLEAIIEGLFSSLQCMAGSSAVATADSEALAQWRCSNFPYGFD